MAAIRGNPRALLAWFFAIAVYLTGSLYWVSGRARFGTDVVDTLTVVALVLSLLLVMLVIARIFWVASKFAAHPGPSGAGGRP